MSAVARAMLAAAGLPTIALAMLSVPACCCGPDLSGPPGTISGQVVLPETENGSFALYVIDANQFWDFSEASYQQLQLDPGSTNFSVALTPRYYWLAAVVPDGEIGMLAAPGYVVVTSSSNRIDVNVTDWTGRGGYVAVVKHVLAVPDPLPLGSPLVKPGNNPRATVSPWRNG